jgi:hypothetical protein
MPKAQKREVLQLIYFQREGQEPFKRNQDFHPQLVATLGQRGGFQPTTIHASCSPSSAIPNLQGRGCIRDSLSNALTKPGGKGMLGQE